MSSMGWSVNDKKARIRDVGVVNYKDTPRKVVRYRTAAQMVGFRIPSQKVRNCFVGLFVGYGRIVCFRIPG